MKAAPAGVTQTGDGAWAITQKEYVGSDLWQNEFVGYAMEFKEGEMWPKGVRLRLEGKELPVQLSEAESYADGSVKRAKVCFVASLPANGAVTYTLTGGKKGDAAAKHKTDLKVAKGRKNIEISTDQVGVRLLGGNAAKVSLSGKDIPAPLQAVRLSGAKGAWVGSGKFETKLTCTGYAVTILDEGPVFFKAKIRYDFAKPDYGKLYPGDERFAGKGWDDPADPSVARYVREAPYYEMVVRVVYSQATAYIEEDINMTRWALINDDGGKDAALNTFVEFRPQTFWDMALNPDMTPAQKWAIEYNWDWWGSRSHAAPDNFVFSFYGEKFKPALMTLANGRASHPDITNGNYAPKDFPDLGEGRRLFTLIPSSGNGNRDSCRWGAFGDGTDYVVVFPSQMKRWRQPDTVPRTLELLVQQNDTLEMRVFASEANGKRDVYLKNSLSLGKREWVIMAMRQDAREMFDALNKQAVRLTNYTLDEVKDWVLEWDDAGVYYPNLTVKPEGGLSALEVLRRNIKASDFLTRYLETTQDNDYQRNRAFYRKLLLGDDTQETFDEVYGNLRERLDKVFFGTSRHDTPEGNLTWPNDGINTTCISMGYIAREADVLLGSPLMTADKKRELLSRIAFMAYMLRDGAWAPRSASTKMGSSNMPVQSNMGRYHTAAMLLRHPMYDEWVGNSLAYVLFLLNDEKTGLIGADGSPMSCPHYMGAGIGAISPAIVSLNQKGMLGDDLAKTFPNLYKNLRFMVDMMTPVDPRVGTIGGHSAMRIIPPEGHGEPFDGNYLASTFATLVKESDPQLAGELMWAWETSGRQGVNALLMDGTITAKIPEMKSALYPGFGAFLRAGDY
ncbi:MAG: hypothetical protein FWF84_08160, partial [Kiritimatiellaeota bacterium]|nr:hypothetical protein [Kiritimatiellota bacterium]